MEQHEIEDCVQWFRQGLYDKLLHDNEEKHRFNESDPEALELAYEAGLTLGEQILCGRTGHKDDVSNCFVSTSARYAYEEFRICRRCDRSRTSAIALFDNRGDLNAYSLAMCKKRREAEGEG